MPTPELGVSIALLLLPVIAVAVGFVVGGYRHRYAIPMVLGLGGVVGLLAGTSRSLRPAMLLAVLSAWLVVRSAGYAALLWSNSPPDLLARHPMLRVAMREPAVPILLSNDATYTQLRHYGPPELVRRLAIAMPPHDMAVPRFEDSSERAMRALDRWRPIALEEYTTLKQRAGTFFVYGDARWLVLQLMHDGARVELVGEGFGQAVAARDAAWPGWSARDTQAAERTCHAAGGRRGLECSVVADGRHHLAALRENAAHSASQRRFVAANVTGLEAWDSGQPIYDTVFFRDRVKFQYPPSSLLLPLALRSEQRSGIPLFHALNRVGLAATIVVVGLDGCAVHTDLADRSFQIGPPEALAGSGCHGGLPASRTSPSPLATSSGRFRRL